MDPTQWENRLDGILSFIEQGARNTSAFAAEQAPLVAQEIIHWGIASALIRAAIFLLLGGALLAAARAFYKKFRGADDSEERFGWGMGCGFASVIGGLLLLVGVGTNLFWAAKPYFAPRVYLIETVVDMAKGVRR